MLILNNEGFASSFMTVADVLDRYTIALIKREKGINVAITAAEVCFVAKQNIGLVAKLKCVNESIWWCMDKLRDYGLPAEDRGQVGIITGFLNDLRDSIKQEIQKEAGGRIEPKTYEQDL